MQTPPASPQYAYAPSLGSTTNVPQVAQELQSQGRNGDTMMVHMSPQEVGGLQALANMQGTSLTVNPNTGMPEAFKLGKFFKQMLPTLLGAGLAATGVGAPLAAGIVGLGSTALTGSLQKGLFAGLGAFGGASLAGAAGLGGKLAGGNAFGLLSDKAGILGANMGAGAVAPGLSGVTALQTGSLLSPTAGVVDTAGLSTVANKALVSGGLQAMPLAAQAAQAATPALAAATAPEAAKVAAPGFLSRFGATARTGLGSGILAKAAPYAAGLGLATPFMSTSSGQKDAATGAIDNAYQGPYYYEERTPTFAKSTEELLKSSAQRDYFDIDQPAVFNRQGQMVRPGSHTAPGTPIMQSVLNPNAKKNEPMYSFRQVPYMTPDEQAQQMAMGRGFRHGGQVPLEDGSFIVDARSTAEIGRGSNKAGAKELAKIGGKLISGPGTGVSDSIRAKIGGTQEARVADGEVMFSPEAVKRIGGGDHKKGAKKLYALMRNAEKARKSAKRGQDTGGLKALMASA